MGGVLGLRKLTVLLAVFFLCTLLLAQTSFAAVLEGNVYDYQLNTAQDVLVTINTVPEKTLSSSNGLYRFELPAGSYIITASAEGLYAEDEVIVESSQKVYHDLFLYPDWNEEQELLARATSLSTFGKTDLLSQESQYFLLLGVLFFIFGSYLLLRGRYLARKARKQLDVKQDREQGKQQEAAQKQGKRQETDKRVAAPDKGLKKTKTSAKTSTTGKSTTEKSLVKDLEEKKKQELGKVPPEALLVPEELAEALEEFADEKSKESEKIRGRKGKKKSAQQPKQAKKQAGKLSKQAAEQIEIEEIDLSIEELTLEPKERELKSLRKTSKTKTTSKASSKRSKKQDSPKEVKAKGEEPEIDDNSAKYVDQVMRIIKANGGQMAQSKFKKELSHLPDEVVESILTGLEFQGKLEIIKKGRGHIILLKK